IPCGVTCVPSWIAATTSRNGSSGTDWDLNPLFLTGKRGSLSAWMPSGICSSTFSTDGRLRAFGAAGAKASVAPILIFLEAHAPGRLRVLRPRRQIAQRLQSLRRGTLPDLVEDPRGVRVQRLSRVPQPVQVNQVLVGIEPKRLEAVGRQPVLEVLRILVDQSPFSAPVAQLQQRQPVLHGYLLAHLLSQRWVGPAVSTGNFAESVVHWRRDLLR